MTTGPTREMAKVLTAGLFGLTSVLVSCGSGGARRPGDLRGVELPVALDKVDFVLQDTEGKAFDFRSETEGYLTLLFFGYTNCPDVCPVHMAGIASVLRNMESSVASRVKVVMVTVDPDRDTPRRLREWLDNFDTSFIGLRGDLSHVREIMNALNMAPPAVDSSQGTNYLVGHPSQVIVYTTDNRAHLVYPHGTRQRDWAHDIPMLVDATWDS